MDPNQHIPPKYAGRFLEWFLRDELAEEVLGDLTEKFYQTLDTKSPFRAKINYWYQVLNYLRPFAIRKSKSSIFNNFPMFHHYVKISWRNLLRQKLYAILNIGGLTIGITCFLLIFLFVQHELSYDRFYENGDRIYRMIQRQQGNMYMGSDYFAFTPAPLAKALVEEYPEIEVATSIYDYSTFLSIGEDFYEEEGLWADKNFFDVFSTEFLVGNPEKAFEQKNAILLTQSLAFKMFGREDPMGKTIQNTGQRSYTVTGIIADPPTVSTIKYHFITNILENRDYQRQKWDNNAYYTFFSVVEQANIEDLEAKMPALIKKYRAQDDQYPFEDLYIIDHISEMHLLANINFDIGLKGDAKYIYLFSTIAIIVLLLACINYINLAVARSVKRAKEVGMRKVIGAVKRQLVEQFLGESILIASMALLLSLVLTYLLLPVFSHLVERPIELNFTDNIWLLPSLLFLVFLVGIISGSYPALFMSSLKPIHVLKGKLEKRIAGKGIQNLLVVGQYVVSMVLITSSLIIYQQLDYIKKKDTGYQKDYIITVPIKDRTIRQKYESIKEEWKTNANVLSVTWSKHLPTNIVSSTIINNEEGGNPDDDMGIYNTTVDYDFLEVFGIELIAGRNFSKEFSQDQSSGLILNETAARALGWEPSEALGKELYYQGQKTVIGIVKDFHMHSMHLAIQPLMLRLGSEYMNYISVKVSPDNLPETIAFMEVSMRESSPFPFEYRFLDEYFDRLYKSDVRMGETFGFFTLIALLIASLGLFGLAACAAEQRTKEIGIRKVLGASIQNILTILTKDFLIMVIVAFFIAVPIAWYGMNEWLQNFAYSVEIHWWVFVITLILALFIAIITISYQAIKSALMNPIYSLRSE